MSSPKLNPGKGVFSDAFRLATEKLKAAQGKPPAAVPTTYPNPNLGPAANAYVNKALPKPVGLPPPHPLAGQNMRDYAIKQGIVRADGNRNLIPPSDPAKILLPHGAYGCAYRPPLKCDGEFSAKKGTITKLMSKKHADDEIAEAAIVKSVDPVQKYFVYAERSCDKTVGVQNADTAEIEKCGPAGRIPTGEKASMLIMPDGGSSLARVQVKKSTRGPILASFRNLMVGLQRLHDAGHVHFDIKPDNIVTNDAYSTRFIDFGLMRPHNPPKPDIGMYMQNYPYWPFELKLLARGFDMANLQTYLESFMSQSIKYSLSSRDLDMIRVPVTNKFPPHAAMAEWEDLLVDSTSNPLTGSKILVGTDVYALGRAMAEFYNRITFHTPLNMMTEIEYGDPRQHGRTQAFTPDMKSDITLSEFSKKWYTMTENMTHIVPSKRWSLLHAIDYFDTDISPIIKQYFPETGASRKGTKRNKSGGRTRRRRA
jgi:serine/threonine protein kinase